MKNKKITIRITDSQFERLTEKVINEQISRSKYLRNLIENQEICRKKDDDFQILEKGKNKLPNIIK
jgi:hypothetical protein